MDLEKIPLTPSLQVRQLYYLKKLKTYNFTLYYMSLESQMATNYMWHEGTGSKGSSEIATCLWKHLFHWEKKMKLLIILTLHPARIVM